MTITLATLKDATRQQIFDQVARHLLKQGKRAVSAQGRCKYRTDDGLKCAAGCLISDEEYDSNFEMRGSWPSVVTYASSTVTHVHEQFITELQRMHDKTPTLIEEIDGVDFTARLSAFAQEYGLQFNLDAFDTTEQQA